MEIAELLGYEEEVEVAYKINEIIRYLKSSINNLNEIITTIDYRNLRIGDPVPTLDFQSVNAPENCIWLNGDEKRIIYYPMLHNIYGSNYNIGNEQAGFFRVPNIKDRVLWGGTSAGYISAGLPQHQHYLNVEWTRHGEAGGGGVVNWCNGDWDITRVANPLSSVAVNNSIYGASSTVQPPAIKVRFYTRYQ